MRGDNEQLYRHGTQLQLDLHLGIAYQCIGMNPVDQCLGTTPGLPPLPLQKSKRFFPGGVEVPEKDNPDCLLIVDNDGSTPILAETGNSDHLTSEIAVDDDGDDYQDSIFAINDV